MSSTKQTDDIGQPENTDSVVFEPTENDGETQAFKEKIKNLNEKLALCQSERDENLLGWQRMKADFINYKKMLAEENETKIAHSTERIFLDILPIVDSFQSAKHDIERWNAMDKILREGLENTFRKFEDMLKRYDLNTFGEVGDKFDPRLHLPVAVDNSGGTGVEIVKQVIQKGYQVNGRIIRPAHVIIGEGEK